ncbi:hypothetical protein S58_16260 [Bradyrhizobium oligotrophicum S58]|uniref:Uncharacterized protein n=1 Tax=Bradyrhizobium oligotrophicum S58 TaxID=1245469 RepID=M4Z3L0_9BRAD|nr:hypothetical protein [Bradyrhizobium oligotrophicum]BAM87634.1 hypothetical protein S58_16260 [Bradyrhizobium oligotrophicum S58]
MNCFVDGYDRPCMRESEHVDPVSPGKIRDDEVLCRAGYTMHIKGGNPVVSLIRADELARGELSVWRLTPPFEAADVDNIVNILRERSPSVRQPQELLRVFGLSAEKLRDLVEDCPICVVDDTDCGPAWDRHPKHCTLGGCKSLAFHELNNADGESPLFYAMRRALLEEFRRNQIWAAAAT